MLATSVLVPKASMYENRGVVARQQNVWRTGQFFRVKPEPKAQRVQNLAHNQLGLGVTAANGSHDLRDRGRDLSVLREGDC
jgi:hypothetical protein